MRAERLVLEPIIHRCRSGADGFDCLREGSAWRVRLWGGVPDGWAGNFALHAFALGIEIVSGEAIRIAATRWAATFSIRPADPHARVACHDFLHMARRAPRSAPPLPEPDIEIAWSEASDGSRDALCRVTGRDAIGLLAEVLRRFDALELRPRELSISTSGDDVDDWFRLERNATGLAAAPRREGGMRPRRDDRLAWEGRLRWSSPRSSLPARTCRRAFATAPRSSRPKKRPP